MKKPGVRLGPPNRTRPRRLALGCKEVEDENDDEDENDWGSGGRELRPAIAGIVRIKAIDQSGQDLLDRRLSDIAQKVGDPSNEREFDAINVKFFVIKKGLHCESITY